MSASSNRNIATRWSLAGPDSKDPVYEITLPFPPPAGNLCHLCDAGHRSREKLHDHYADTHWTKVTWLCSACSTFSTISLGSIRTHWGRCKPLIIAKSETSTSPAPSSAEASPSGCLNVSEPGKTSGTRSPDSICEKASVGMTPPRPPLTCSPGTPRSKRGSPSQSAGRKTREGIRGASKQTDSLSTQTDGSTTKCIILFPPLVLQCPICASITTSRSKLRLHVLDVHGRTLYWNCSKCLRQLYARPESMSVHFSKCSAATEDVSSGIVDPNSLRGGRTLSAERSAPSPSVNLTDSTSNCISSGISDKLDLEKSNTQVEEVLQETDPSSRGNASHRLPIIEGSVATIDGFSGTAERRLQVKLVPQRIVYTYPPERLLCTLCNTYTSSRAKLEFHLLNVHARTLYWTCSKCHSKSYPSSQSMSSHFSRCLQESSQGSLNTFPVVSSPAGKATMERGEEVPHLSAGTPTASALLSLNGGPSLNLQCGAAAGDGVARGDGVHPVLMASGEVFLDGSGMAQHGEPVVHRGSPAGAQPKLHREWEPSDPAWRETGARPRVANGTDFGQHVIPASGDFSEHRGVPLDKRVFSRDCLPDLQDPMAASLAPSCLPSRVATVPVLPCSLDDEEPMFLVGEVRESASPKAAGPDLVSDCSSRCFNEGAGTDLQARAPSGVGALGHEQASFSQLGTPNTATGVLRSGLVPEPAFYPRGESADAGRQAVKPFEMTNDQTAQSQVASLGNLLDVAENAPMAGHNTTAEFNDLQRESATPGERAEPTVSAFVNPSLESLLDGTLVARVGGCGRSGGVAPSGQSPFSSGSPLLRATSRQNTRPSTQDWRIALEDVLNNDYMADARRPTNDVHSDSDVAPSERRGSRVGRNGRPRAAMSHGRWTIDELRALATIEQEIGGHPAINQEISRRWPGRSYMSIVMTRRTPRYKEAMAHILREKGDPICDSAAPSAVQGDSGVILTMCRDDVLADFAMTRFPNQQLAGNIASTPITMQDIQEIYNHYGVRVKKAQARKSVRVILEESGGRSRRGRRRRARYKLHQHLYKMGPKVLLQKLLEEDTTRTPVSLRDLHGVFDVIFSNPAPPPGNIYSSGRKISAEPSLFEWDEVEAAIRSLNQGSSPGPDGVRVRELKRVPTEILMHIINNFLTFQHIPDQLKISRSVFIPKKGSPECAEDYRPITISSVLVRLFSRLVLSRLSLGHSFHDLQGGFEGDRAAASNLLLLQGAMRLAKSEKRSFIAASIDLRKAFDSVGHEALFSALLARGADPFWISLVRNSYTNCSTVFWKDGATDGVRVPLRRGVKQGDPLSPFLFNTIMDPLLHRLNTSGTGFSVGAERLSAMAYADDLIILGDSVAGLQRLTWEVERYFQNIRLEINVSKTRYFGWNFDSQRKWFRYQLPPLQLGGIPIDSVEPNEKIRYLGLSIYVNKTAVADIAETMDQVTAIRKASLKPFQKITCIRQLLLPLHLYATSASLRWMRDGQLLDNHFRTLTKETLHLPHSFPTHMVYLPTRDGGLGMLNIQSLAAEIQFKAFARLGRLGNPLVDNLINVAFTDHLEKLRDFLGIYNTAATRSGVNGQVKASRKERLEVTRGSYENASLFSHIGNHLGNRWLNPSCQYLSDGDRIKALRLRANIYPTRTLFNKHTTDPAARRCRRCGTGDETTFHILQVCDRLHDQRCERHNWLVRQVVRLVKKNSPNAVIKTEVTHSAPDGQRLRPDIIIETAEGVSIVDLAVTWDSSPSILDMKNKEKAAKYACLSVKYAPRPTHAMGLTLGARSMVSDSTRKTAGLIGISPADIAWLSARTLVGSLIMLQRFARLV